MLKQYFLLFTLLICTTLSKADPSQDSLKLEIRKQTDSLILSRISYDIAFSYHYSNIDSTKKYLAKAIKYSPDIQDSTLLANIYKLAGFYYSLKGDIDSTRFYVHQSILYMDSLHHINKYIETKIVLVDLLLSKYKIKDAFSILIALESIPNKTIEKKFLIASEFSYLYYKKKEFGLSLSSLLKILPLIDSLKDKKYKVKYYVALSNAYQLEKKIKKAIEYNKKAYAIALALKNKYFQAVILNNIGDAYLQINNYTQSIYYLKKTIPFYKKNNKDDYIGVLSRIIKSYSKRQQFDSAYWFLIETNKIKHELKSPQTTSLYYDAMVSYYEEKKDFKNAFLAASQYISLEDSIQRISNDELVNQLRLEYETQKKERENKILKQKIIIEKKEKAQLQSEKKIGIIMQIAMIVILLFLSILFYYYRKDIMHRKAISKERMLRLEQETKINKQEKAKLLQERELKELKINSLRQDKLLLEKENSLQEVQQEIVKQKLNTHKNILASTNNSLLQQSQLTNELITTLKELRPFSNKEGKERINSQLAALNDYSKEKNWQVFQQNFILLYPNFNRQIKERFAELTKAEMRLCSFIKMQLSTAEISRITFQSSNTISVLKRRIRLKMGFTNNDELEEFILNFE